MGTISPELVEKIAKELSDFGAFIDDRPHRPGFKFNEWEMKGLPLRVELGPKDLEKKSVVVVRRDTGEKKEIPITDLKKEIPGILDQMHKDMLAKAKKHLDDNIVENLVNRLIKRLKLNRIGGNVMNIKEVYDKLIGIYDCLQNQLYYQIERIENLEKSIIDIKRLLEGV